MNAALGKMFKSIQKISPPLPLRPQANYWREYGNLIKPNSKGLNCKRKLRIALAMYRVLKNSLKT